MNNVYNLRSDLMQGLSKTKIIPLPLLLLPLIFLQNFLISLICLLFGLYFTYVFDSILRRVWNNMFYRVMFDLLYQHKYF